MEQRARGRTTENRGQDSSKLKVYPPIFGGARGDQGSKVKAFIICVRVREARWANAKTHGMLAFRVGDREDRCEVKVQREERTNLCLLLFKQTLI